MAANDIKVVKNPGPTITYLTDDRNTSSQTVALLPGEPVKRNGAGSPFVIAVATGDPEIGTDELAGVVRKTSTETATADGKVEVVSIIGGTVLRGKATTTANIDTQTEIDALVGDWVAFDVTGAGTNGPTGVFTIDENEGDDPNVHGLKVIAGDPTRTTLDVLVHPNASYAPLTGQTMD